MGRKYTGVTVDPREAYGAIVDRVIADLEAGVGPWIKPWAARARAGGVSGLPFNGASGHKYRGINVLVLGLSGYCDARWYSFAQAKDKGGMVRAGEKATRIFFFRQIQIREAGAADDGGDKLKQIPLMRSYCVFNREQIEWSGEAAAPVVEPIAIANDDGPAYPIAVTIRDGSGAAIEHGGDSASYSPGFDRIRLPVIGNFRTEGDYWGTCFHELGHWTGAAKRLDRDMGGRFGADRYAAEELIAELTAALLCGVAAVDGKLQHAEYLAHWARILRADKGALMHAASKAQAAADFLLMAAGVLVADDETESAAA